MHIYKCNHMYMHKYTYSYIHIYIYIYVYISIYYSPFSPPFPAVILILPPSCSSWRTQWFHRPGYIKWQDKFIYHFYVFAIISSLLTGVVTVSFQLRKKIRACQEFFFEIFCTKAAIQDYFFVNFFSPALILFWQAQ